MLDDIFRISHADPSFVRAVIIGCCIMFLLLAPVVLSGRWKR